MLIVLVLSVVGFLCLRSVSSVSNVAGVSEFTILDCPFDFLYRLFILDWWSKLYIFLCLMFHSSKKGKMYMTSIVLFDQF